MSARLRLIAWMVAAVSHLAGCSNYTGAVPEQGYDTTRVSYEPKANPEATILEIPLINPTEYPEAPSPLPEPRIWTKSMPIAFVGKVQRFDSGQEGTLVRFEVSSKLADGQLDHCSANQTLAMWKKGDEHISYRVDWRAPSRPGRYHVAIKTVGPSLDFANLDTFVEGEVEVR